MVHIKKIKTWYGAKYAVVKEHISQTTDDDGNMVKSKDYFSVEYKNGREIQPAIFPLTDEGLERAKKIQSLYNK